MRLSPYAAAIAMAISASAQASGTFIPLETQFGQAIKFSQNGKYLSISINGGGSARWNSETGVEEIVPGLGTTQGVNNAGTIAGSVPVNGGSREGGTDVPALSPVGAAMPALLPLPADTDNADVYDVSDDGSAVGLTWLSDWSISRAYYYSAAQNAIVVLPVDTPSEASRGNSISADGSIIAGWNDDPDTGFRRGVVWKDLVQIYPSVVIDGAEYNVGEASAVSGNGKWVVGSQYPNSSGTNAAWRYNVETGELTEIPGIPFAFGVSDDGKIVVGASGFWDFPARAAFIWTEEWGTQMMTDYLAARNIEVPADWGFSGGLTAVSGDGTMAAGWTIDSPNGMQSYVVTGLDSQLDRIFSNGFDGPPPVKDPSFEKTQGNAGQNPYWQSGDTNPDNPDGTVFYSYFGGHTGGWAAVLGAHQNAEPETQYFSQSVEMLSSPPAYLNYWRYVGSLPDSAGTLTVSVDGAPVQTVDFSALAAPDDDFVPQSVDISSYADGGTHVVKFEYVYPGGGSDGGTLIDDVTIDSTSFASRRASRGTVHVPAKDWLVPKRH